MESSNPTLNERTFGAARVGVGEPAMTVQGTVNKTFILLAVLVSAATWTWSKTSDPSSAGFVSITFIGSMIVGLILYNYAVNGIMNNYPEYVKPILFHDWFKFLIIVAIVFLAEGKSKKYAISNIVYLGLGLFIYNKLK